MGIRTLAIAGLVLLAVGAALILVIGRQDAGEAPPPEPGIDASLPLPTVEEAAAFLDEYNARYRHLWTAAEGAKWQANVDITEANSAAEVQAAQALADYVGSRQVIDRLVRLRRIPDLSELLRRQIDKAWELAAHYPGTAPATVSKLLQAEAAQSARLHSFRYSLAVPGREPREVTTNEIDRLLLESRDLAERRAVWECSKLVGPPLKDGLAELQTLRNAVAEKMDYSSFFALECADYGLTSAEMMMLMDDLLAGIQPLYEQLHCWVRHELAARYGEPVPPRLIPAHWLANRWGQEWPGIVAGVDLDGMFRDVSPQWLIEQGERFYTSLGFPNLPLTFWGRSDLYELPADANRSKNTHASAWHIDLDQDVRSLMNVRNDFQWFSTVHHELGHVYYYLSYARPEVPPILRRGANRGFHEAVGTLVELASNQVPYLEEIALLKPGEAPDQVRWLLNQALTGPVVFLPFACGTMTHWEHDFYENDLPRHLYNERWWRYAAHYQGIAPPAERGEEWCDAATKTHISDDPAQYYDYALSYVILHQLHRYICQELLHQDVHGVNYYGSAQVGIYLESILSAGATRDWNRLLFEATGEPLSASALLDYFEPLQAWLQEQNAGRAVGFR
ncbi:MAG TPA: M2 family metallopeptidase [Candidatus Krumholzibacteria bacterium]|nr:M2 family metallopeptidase [Candidatus Krumholzibacteria bacterium]HPD72580.1 M2 family metallopeptidase [Candidatus Krumholzibacteria bacterium]HRY40488.1 M2 family metallopeptidase [Candidatus Krumholzibacteria bacterium]